MEFKKLFEILPYQLKRYPQQKALVYHYNNDWISFSTEESLERIQKISAGFLNLKIKKGDAVAIMSRFGSPMWNVVDFALQQIGVIVIPLHSTMSSKALSYVLNDAKVKYCFVTNQQMYEAVNSVKKTVDELKEIYSFEKIDGVKYWEELLITPSQEQLDFIENTKEAINENDLATIIYTSGTTGNPKGVMLSHKNILSNIQSIISMVPVNYQKRTMSFLPMSHIFERMVTYTYMVVGASIYYVDSLENISGLMQEVKPHFFTSVPRFLEKTYDTILERGAAKGKIATKILHWGIGVGEQYRKEENFDFFYKFKLSIADFLVFRHWRKALGGNIEGVVVGAAAMQAHLGRLFSAAKIEIREGYGLTETSPVVSFNRFEPGGVRFGTVGIPIPGVEVKIEEADENGEGEILVKGPNVMMGYHNLVNKTAEVIDKEGWFHTGDVGKIVYKKFLQITDRKKNIFKTSYGKYIAPLELENHLKESPYIEQCMIVGFNRPYASALIVPNMPMLQKWCSDNKVHWTAPQFMVINPKVEAFMSEHIEALNKPLPNHKHIKAHQLLFEEWTAENGILTNTLKLKRNDIIQQFKKQIEEMY